MNLNNSRLEYLIFDSDIITYDYLTKFHIDGLTRLLKSLLPAQSENNTELVDKILNLYEKINRYVSDVIDLRSHYENIKRVNKIAQIAYSFQISLNPLLEGSATYIHDKITELPSNAFKFIKNMKKNEYMNDSNTDILIVLHEQKEDINRYKKVMKDMLVNYKRAQGFSPPGASQTMGTPPPSASQTRGTPRQRGTPRPRGTTPPSASPFYPVLGQMPTYSMPPFYSMPPYPMLGPTQGSAPAQGFANPTALSLPPELIPTDTRRVIKRFKQRVASGNVSGTGEDSASFGSDSGSDSGSNPRSKNTVTEFTTGRLKAIRHHFKKMNLGADILKAAEELNNITSGDEAKRMNDLLKVYNIVPTNDTALNIAANLYQRIKQQQ